MYKHLNTNVLQMLQFYFNNNINNNMMMVIISLLEQEQEHDDDDDDDADDEDDDNNTANYTDSEMGNTRFFPLYHAHSCGNMKHLQHNSATKCKGAAKLFILTEKRSHLP